MAAGRCRRLIVSKPPRHGKSELVSRAFPAWFVGTFPWKRVILASYEADFAARWGRKARDLLEQHGPIFGVSVRQDSRAAHEWDVAGDAGGMSTAGVGGPITGKGADVLIVDDPVKNAEEAASPTYREKAWDWWTSTAYTRLEPGAAAIVVMTRWHEDDLVGRLLAEQAAGGERWDVVELPAIAGENDALGRAPGEALWPERYPLERLLEIQRAVGPYVWSALYQQRPSPPGGLLFKREWFRHYTVEREATYRLGDYTCQLANMTRFATVDLAASVRTSADYTAIASWGLCPSGELVLLDLLRARLEGPDIVPAIARAVKLWRLSEVAVEKVAFQLSLIQTARRAGVPVRELERDKDKWARALPASTWYQGGRIWHPAHGAPRAELEEELIQFPNGAHDDQVDTVSDAVERAAEILRGKLPPVRAEARSAGPPRPMGLERPSGSRGMGLFSS